MTINRYCGYTLDGTKLFHAQTAQGIADAAFDWIDNNRRPWLAYTFDQTKPEYPYTTWKRDTMGIVGTSHKTFSEMLVAL